MAFYCLLTWRLSSMVSDWLHNFLVVYSSLLMFELKFYVSCFSFFSSVFVVSEQWQYCISCYFVSLCSMLPDTLLTCHMYAQFISLYRQLLTEVIMDEGRDSQAAGNYLIALCMRNNETSPSCFWLPCTFHQRNMGLDLSVRGCRVL